jgi:predicted HTH transcriptional regulator
MNDNKEPEIDQKETELSTEELIADLDDMDKEIIRLKVQNPKITDTELGKRFKVTRHTVAKHLKKEKVKFALNQLQQSALDVLLNAQSEAARRMIKHMRDTDPDISLKACKEILTGVLAKSINIKGDRGPIRRFLDGLTDEDLDSFEE